jgi:hypothetical protein
MRYPNVCTNGLITASIRFAFSGIHIRRGKWRRLEILPRNDPSHAPRAATGRIQYKRRMSLGRTALATCSVHHFIQGMATFSWCACVLVECENSIPTRYLHHFNRLYNITDNVRFELIWEKSQMRCKLQGTNLVTIVSFKAAESHQSPTWLPCSAWPPALGVHGNQFSWSLPSPHPTQNGCSKYKFKFRALVSSERLTHTGCAQTMKTAWNKLYNNIVSLY